LIARATLKGVKSISKRSSSIFKGDVRIDEPKVTYVIKGMEKVTVNAEAKRIAVDMKV